MRVYVFLFSAIVFTVVLALFFMNHLSSEPNSALLLSESWTTVAPGLEIGALKVKKATLCGDSTVTILRVDPSRWDLDVLCAGEHEEINNMSARQWCSKFGLIAAMNAGLFATDNSTHVGYLQRDDYVNNPRVTKYQSVAAFSPRIENLPMFQIYDLDANEIASIKKNYRRIVQNLRLIKRPGINRWSKQTRMWSEAALGEDEQGRALFIFCRSPYSMYDFNEILLSLPINIMCAQHLEGGPEAQLFVKFGETELELVGSHETGFFENDLNKIAWPIPNIIGVISKD